MIERAPSGGWVSYRFFSEPEWAERMLAGHLYTTTIERCRMAEGDAQRDEDDGTHTYLSGEIRGGGNDPAFVAMAARSGIQIGPGAVDIRLSGVVHRRMLDAWVLCTTLAPALEKFGRFGVRIADSQALHALVEAAMRRAGFSVEGRAGPVHYRPLQYTGMQEPPAIGFAKAPRFSAEREFRLLWSARGQQALAPREWHCPEAKRLLTPWP